MCYAVVEGDVCEGSLGSGEGVPSVFCSRACGAEHFHETGGLTGRQTAMGWTLGPALVRDEEKREQEK